MSGKLKPCPFCGSTDVRLALKETYVTCLDCGADGPVADEHSGAVEKWNAAMSGVDQSERIAKIVEWQQRCYGALDSHGFRQPGVSISENVANVCKQAREAADAERYYESLQALARDRCGSDDIAALIEELRFLRAEKERPAAEFDRAEYQRTIDKLLDLARDQHRFIASVTPTYEPNVGPPHIPTNAGTQR